jgi:hypothetical protein
MGFFRVAILSSVLFFSAPGGMSLAAPNAGVEEPPPSAGEREQNGFGDQAEAFLIGLAVAALVAGGSFAYALAKKSRRDADEVLRQAASHSRVDARR